MKQSALDFVVAATSLTLAACAPNGPTEHYGYVARLGRDTVSIENVTRRGDRVTIDGVDRFPRVRRRHTEIQLDTDGGIRHLVMDINTPSAPDSLRDRHVEADVKNGRVHMTKRDKSSTLTRDLVTQGAPVMAHVPQMYGLYDIYFTAARRHVAAPRGDDTVHMRQFYIDREFDRFSMHNAVVRLIPNNRAEIWHDWLAGVGEASLDSAGHLLAYSGARTTYKVEVERLKDSANVEAIATAFASAEAKGGGARELSVRDTVRATIGAASFMVDYSRPLARGRVLLGNIIPYDRVWRTGANAATQFTTSAPITIAGMSVPAGTYTLWTVPRHSGVSELIVNSQTKQWGTEFDEKFNLGMSLMRGDTTAGPTEKFTISIVPDGDKRGALIMEWGNFRWAAPIVLK